MRYQKDLWQILVLVWDNDQIFFIFEYMVKFLLNANFTPSSGGNIHYLVCVHEKKNTNSNKTVKENQ